MFSNKYKHGIFTLYFCLIFFDLSAQWSSYQTPPFSINGYFKTVRKGENTLIIHSDNIYISEDFGSTWQKKHPAFGGMRDFLIQKNTLWINDGTSVYKSENDGASWQKLNNIPITSRSYIDAIAVGESDTIFLALRDTFSLISYDKGNTWVRKAQFEMFRTTNDFKCVLYNNAIYASDGLSGSKFDIQQNRNIVFFNGRFSITGVFNKKLFIYSDNTLSYFTLNGVDWKIIPFGLGVPLADDNGKNIYMTFSSSSLNVVNDTLFKNLPNNVLDNRIKKFTYNSLKYNSVTACPIVAMRDTTTFIVTNPINGIYKTINGGALYNRTSVDNRTLPVKKLTKVNKTYFASTNQGIFSTDSTFLNWKLINKGVYSFATDFFMYADENIMLTNTEYSPNNPYIPMISRDGGATWSTFTNNWNDRFYDIVRNNTGYVLDISSGWYLSKDTLKTLEFSGLPSLGTRHNDRIIFQLQDNAYTWLDENGQLKPKQYILSMRDSYIKGMANSGSKFYALANDGRIHISEDYGQNWAVATTKPLLSYDDVQSLSDKIKMKASGDTLVFNFLQYLRFVTANGTKSITISGKDENGVFENEINDQNLYIVGDKIWVRNQKNVKMVSFTGLVYRDDNNNRRLDLGENGFSKVKVITQPDGNIAITDSNGKFEMMGDANFTDSISVRPDGYKYYKLNPTSKLIQNFLQVDSNRLGVYLLPTAKDVEVQLSYNMVARPGFDFSMYLKYRNVGSQTSQGTIKLQFDNNFKPKLSSPMFDTLTPQYLEWKYANLAAGEERTIKITFNTNTTAPIRTQTINIAQIKPFETDTFLNNNIDTLIIPILGSFDPNDKSVAVGNGISKTPIIDKNKELIYTIRFQNTGNYAADFVKVIDTLSEKLDPTTIRLIDVSHNYTLTIRNKNVLVFDFNAIKLPDSMSNEQGSHGFIRFGIKPKTDLSNADVIRNKAFIYFDFNPAIITNVTETKNIISSIYPILKEANELSVFPNPSSGNISFKMTTHIGENMVMSIYALDGRLLMSSSNIVQEQNDTHLSFLKDGFYFLHINIAGNYYVGKFKIIHQ